jgi:hypothetical protein
MPLENPDLGLWTRLDDRFSLGIEDLARVALETSLQGFTAVRACLPPAPFRNGDKPDRISLTFTKNQT